MGVQINGDTGNVIATKGTFSGDVGIGGTLTYEDVTNVDSLGIITARNGIKIGTGVGVAASISVDGNAEFSGIVTATTFKGNITGTTGTFTGAVTDSKGDIRSIPANSQSGAYVAVAADAGKAIYISTGGVTINDSVFSAGDAVTIINNSGSNQTITQGSGVTLYNAADATTGNRTLAGRGMSTIWFVSASAAYISGAGLS
tara:strand:+ start:19 stop:621 length:603 start_codon:yes stop_codon:yes gene_type:complete